VRRACHTVLGGAIGDELSQPQGSQGRGRDERMKELSAQASWIDVSMRGIEQTT
jgi:hypothetical protein